MSASQGRYIILVSVHGLIRGQDLELGRDADTGGQTKYVVELARALARHPGVWRVDLLTRQVIDPKVSDDYAERLEALDDGAFIVRLPAGPRRYLRKEVLWPYLDSFTDAALQHIRRIGRLPDVVHSHYADAGYVAARLTALLGVPMVHTGHSLGRVKQARLREKGLSDATIESQYNMSQRIEAEEVALDNAQMVVASTRQEVEEQYAQYDNYQPKRMRVIPPGTDLERFHPPRRGDPWPPIFGELKRFLRAPKQPMILALSRPDERKNIHSLVEAFALQPGLRDRANLVIVAGNRDDIAELERGPRQVLTQLLLQVDRLDLYGDIALPKHHASEDVPDFYRLAKRLHGLFVNPALTEPFGLTLIEAAASGVPILATHDGGPRDILRHCRNGRLVDPLDVPAIGRHLDEMLSDRRQWTRWSRNGIRGARAHYSWSAHVERYMKELGRIWKAERPRQSLFVSSRSRLPTLDRLLLTALDNTLVGDDDATRELIARLHAAGDHVGFGIATGRTLESAQRLIRKHSIPTPDLIISSVGSEIHYGHGMVQDESWQRHIDFRWEPDRLRETLRQFRGLRLQPKIEQHRFKLSYFYDPDRAPPLRELVRHLRQQDLHANVSLSRNMFLDLLPIRASKGLALRHVCVRWGLEPEKVLVAGSCGNDEELLRGNTLGVVVANHGPELERLRGRPRILFAGHEYARGILDGIDYYNFLGEIRIPDETLMEA